jgi:hypothetical protein
MRVKILEKLINTWRRISIVGGAQASEAKRSIRRKWRRSWLGTVGWPWLRRELEVMLKVSGVIVLSVWVKRLVEQFLGARILNERILQGEVNGLVQEIEQEVSTRRSHGHRRRK